MFQQTVIAGNLGRDPEMRFVPDGTPVTSFSVAVAAGKDKTIWFDVSAWGKLAETSNQFLHKGDQVIVSGELSEPHAYVGKDGEPKASLQLTARTVRFGRKAAGTTQAPPSGRDEEGEEIPF